MQIFTDKDTLYAQSSFGTEAVKLSAKSENTFNRIDNASVKYTFLSDKNSEADLLVDFGGAIFYFERSKLVIDPNMNISEYSGKYFSEELNVTYEILVSSGALVLSYPNNQGLV